ncbi:MAG: MerR family transcriptional regulator, repressor of the yfmOP operon [Solirubrobacteraceae bacterium]|jgi:DNA-binding transcriptional MerR regulator|nr:MerR family transcriptional regulator, repressor of the yfmOP operon [Solirubrobacteraceae bacterium]
MNAEPGHRIGDVARLAGTTPRTIRYYEEIGLLPGGGESRAAGAHRLYGEADVERLREVMRLKSLLGVSLDELKELIAAEDARAAVRTELRRGDVDPDRRRDLLVEAKGHLERQLELVHRRQAELAKLEADLADRRKRVLVRLHEPGDGAPQRHEDEAGEGSPEAAPAGAGTGTGRG